MTLSVSERVCAAAVVVAAAMVVVGCTSREVATEPSASDPPSGASGNGGAVQEIIVTGSDEGSRTHGRSKYRRAQAPQEALKSSQRQSRALAAVAPGEELWIISQPDAADEPSPAEDRGPGSGAMLARPTRSQESDSVQKIPLPLKHTAVDAAISGYISTVHVKQTFENPFDEKIEAVYLFPLPEKSAVSEFVMTIGDRRIRGILREKAEAQAIYREARAQGYQASLLVQHRPNVFEQKVANIEPGNSIDVDITYFHTLAYQDGWYAFVFPTVVGPRYNPPGSTDPIVAVGTTTAAANNATTAHYLRPDERSAHDISINVRVDAGVTIEDVKSSHQIELAHATPQTADVALANGATIPNRDFVLRYRVAGQRIKSNLLTYLDEQTAQGYFTLMLYPPADIKTMERKPMEMVFVLDCSGSMQGRPLDQAKAAVAMALNQLNDEDTFQIIRFSDNASQFGASPVPATRNNLRQARTYLRGLRGRGGTQMINGIKAALDFPHDASRLRFVSFMTDGYIGNEVDIIHAIHQRIGASRIFSFGVGTSVNGYLLERMAKIGRGAVAYLSPTDSARDIMANFFERVSHPALTNVAVDWSGMIVTDVYPSRLPDLFVGRPVVVTGKYVGSTDRIRVSGQRGKVEQDFEIEADPADASNAHLSKIWARLRIADLSDRQAWEQDPYNELGDEIRQTALEHQLMSAYTSFVAVDASRQTEGTHGTTVHQAVPVPAGVRYDTTVENNRLTR